MSNVYLFYLPVLVSLKAGRCLVLALGTAGLYCKMLQAKQNTQKYKTGINKLTPAEMGVTHSTLVHMTPVPMNPHTDTHLV